MALLTDKDISDPLSANHLEFMKQHDYMPPGDWEGFKREFDE